MTQIKIGNCLIFQLDFAILLKITTLDSLDDETQTETREKPA